MEINEMKSNWQSAKNDINPGVGPQFNERSKTALQRLSDEYRRFSILSALLVLCGPLTLWNAGIKSVWILAAFILFGIASIIVDRTLMRQIRAIDPASMAVAEVLERTMNCRKIHLYWVAFALPSAILWIAATGYEMRADIYFIYGMGAGAVVGLAIGIRVLLKFLRDYREAMDC